MRKAITLHRTAKGLDVHYDDMVPADKQRSEFNSSAPVPSGVLEVLYVPGPFRIKYKDKAKHTSELIAKAEARAKAKDLTAEQRDKLIVDRQAKEAAERQKAEDELRAKEIKAKDAKKAEEAKKAAAATKQ